MEWIEQYLKNYRGESDEAKECEQFLKENYKGDAYLPWAFMLRCLFTQDPDAKYEPIYTEDNSMIHLNSYTLETINKNENTDIATKAPVVCPQVRMKITFLGHEFEDSYPIQDQSYKAPKAVDQNMLNKAKQRCLARLISMATGIGWKLYEGKDLQFEEDGSKSTKGEVQVAEPVKTKAVENEKPSMDLNESAEIVEPTDVAEDITSSPEAQALASFIFSFEDKEAMNKALAGLNNSCIRKYNFAFKANDNYLDLLQKASKLDKPDKFLASIQNKLK